MITSEQILNLSTTQLKDFKRIMFSCQDMECTECPLALQPTEVTLKSGNKFTYTCAQAFASYVYTTNKR